MRILRKFKRRAISVIFAIAAGLAKPIDGNFFKRQVVEYSEDEKEGQWKREINGYCLKTIFSGSLSNVIRSKIN